MKKKLLLTAIVILLIALGIYSFYKYQKTAFTLDNENIYVIITDSKWKTMLNDGGSNTNIFYEINLNTNLVTKVTESYYANLGGTPRTDKKSTTIKIDNKLSKELSKTLNKVFQLEDKNDSSNYNFYTIKKQNKQKYIYNENTIKILKELIKKIERH